MTTILDMDEAEYHAHPALSSTGAKELLVSPKNFRYHRDNPQSPKKEFDLGSAFHTKVLGKGYGVEVLDFPDFRTKAAQTARDDAYAAGKIPVLKRTLKQVDTMVEAVLAYAPARELLQQVGGVPEASVFAHDPEFDINLRARFDFLAARPFDVKSTGTSADKATFSRTVHSFGYDISRAHYLHVLYLATGERREMPFLVAETKPPYDVGLHYLNDQYIEIGEGRARRARELFAECTRTGVWPGHTPEPTSVEPPMYAIYDFQDNFE